MMPCKRCHTSRSERNESAYLAIDMQEQYTRKMGLWVPDKKITNMAAHWQVFKSRLFTSRRCSVFRLSRRRASSSTRAQRYPRGLDPMLCSAQRRIRCIEADHVIHLTRRGFQFIHLPLRRKPVQLSGSGSDQPKANAPSEGRSGGRQRLLRPTTMRLALGT